MKADFSRYGFDPSKHYSGVLHQQGRVMTDADLNEEHALQAYRGERTTADVVGPVGAPARSPGFGIAIDAAGALAIGAGRLYVDGLLIENDSALPYANQIVWQALPAGASNVVQQLSGANTALGLVYLEGFERTVTAVDDDAIRDVALGGPDTSVRSQVVWRVAVEPIDLAANGITLNAAAVSALATLVDTVLQAERNLAAATTDAQRRTLRLQLASDRRALRAAAAQAKISCDGTFAEWTRLTRASGGRVAIDTNPAPATPSPCDVPPGTGYFGGEHQLYRVEAHIVGATATATDSTFKFSRENGSVVALITKAGTASSGSVTSTQVEVNSAGRDAVLGFSDGNWAEYVDDALELAGVPGPIVRIHSARPGSPLVELETAVQVRFGLHPKLRRWDQAGAAATATGVAMGTAPVALERNLRAAFSGGPFRSGDWWSFPARGGRPDSHLPSGAQPPRGIRRHYARLGIVLRSASNQLRLLFDCRPPLPELTALQADRVGYAPGCDRLGSATTVQEALDILCGGEGSKCTVLASPGAGWERVFDGIANGADAEICFPVGAYPTPPQGVIVANKGNLTIAGGGLGTRIDNAGGECAIEFRACASITLRDLSVRAHTTNAADLRGAVTCTDCPSVTVESVTLESGDNSRRNASCLTVRNTIPGDGTNATPSLRVRGCTIRAGEQQHGILAVNVSRAHIEDNVIVCPRPPRVRPIKALLGDRFVLSEASRLIASNTRIVDTGSAPGRDEVAVNFAGRQIAFTADPAVRAGWKGYFAANQPGSGAAVNDAMRHITDLAKQLVSNDALWAQFPAIRDVVQRFQTLPIAGFRGICIAGSRLQEARIVNNTIKFFRHAIHVGLSHAENAQGVPDVADSVTITGNRIEARLMPGDEMATATGRPRAPHAVFAGNVDNLVIEQNQATLVGTPASARAQVCVVVHGVLGPRILVRHNRLDGFSQAVRITSERAVGPRLWMVAENVCARCSMAAVGLLNPPLAQVTNIVTP